MSKKIIGILILVLPFFSSAQKQGNIWYFGIQSGLDFSSGIPVAISNGQTGSDVSVGDNQEGTSCISDSSGNILFYTGGKTIWNKNNIPMPNGSGLMGGTSSTQSSIIIPLPNRDSVFYVFTSDEYQSYSSPPEKGYRYSVVNMCLDNGNGDVLPAQKNILLLDSSTEKLAACEDANGTGYWVMGHKMFSDKFCAWHLTSLGISNTVISNIGTIHGWDNVHSSWIAPSAQGQMKFSPDGTKLALVIGNFQPAYLDLFDFNLSTGTVSNFCHIVIDSVLQKSVYGVEFSPDGSKLYIESIGGAGGTRLYQYNLLAGLGSCDSITTSRKTLFQSSNNPSVTGMQVAPNGKIYLICSYSSQNNLGCINSPNSLGLAANFDSLAVITGNNAGYALPSFIAGYKYHNKIVNCSFGNGINESKLSNQLILFPNPSSKTISLIVNGVSELKNASIIIQNVLGEEVIRTSNLLLPTSQINVSSLSQGCYFLQITLQSGEVYQTKFVKQ